MFKLGKNELEWLKNGLWIIMDIDKYRLSRHSPCQTNL